MRRRSEDIDRRYAEKQGEWHRINKMIGRVEYGYMGLLEETPSLVTLLKQKKVTI